jgi:hypothetical protein
MSDSTKNEMPEYASERGKKMLDPVNEADVLAREAYEAPPWAPKTISGTGATRVLLADGTETFECDDCKVTSTTAYGVFSHRAHKHRTDDMGPRRYAKGPRYTQDVLRHIMRTVTTHKATGARNFLELTTDQLNREGLRTINDKEFTVPNVSAIWAKYHKNFRTVRRSPKVTRATQVAADIDTLTPVSGPASQTASLVTDDKALGEARNAIRLAQRKLVKIDGLVTQLQQESSTLLTALNQIDNFLSTTRVAADDDAELRAKAARFDALAQTLHGAINGFNK